LFQKKILKEPGVDVVYPSIAGDFDLNGSVCSDSERFLKEDNCKIESL
jgi:hypothetical protein